MLLKDIPELPPRSLKALIEVDIESTEVASIYSAASLLALPGVGEKTLEILRQNGWKAGQDDSLFDGGPAEPKEDPSTKLAEDVFAPPGGTIPLAHPLYGSTGSGSTEMRTRFNARSIFMRLTENAAPSPGLITMAWELALFFEQEGERLTDRPFVVMEGGIVEFGGKLCRVKTGFKAGEARPDGMKTIGLVPVGE